MFIGRYLLVLNVLETLSRSRTDEILVYLCLEGGARFSEFEHELELNPSMVSRRLTSLVDLGAVSKERGHYQITDEGRALVAAYNYLDGEECEKRCSRSQCVGPVYHAAAIVDECEGRPSCQVLAAMPGTIDEIATNTDVDDVDNVVEMLTRWDLARRDGNFVERTDAGDRVRAMTEALETPSASAD
jgi:DNA-binding HxlR family transcriptional regulator